ncbi:MAG: SAM-dependent methyltransferase [Bacteroidales bacterium]|jgi:16S rRNA (cytidine1402-2'-O)-methyltransferase|nr:SAM-dependent methyltransferase [Bacteroidales bacterium]
MTGTLYLIPTPISEEAVIDSLTGDIVRVLHKTQHYAVENIRSARRFIKSVDRNINIDELTFYEIGKNSSDTEKSSIIDILISGKNVGIMSEAGAPGVADPGSDIVLAAHKANINVMPLVGASSILLALMGSGLNGQKFVFHGYLPIKQNERQKAIRQLEKESHNFSQSQLFIETPYRNKAIFDDLIKTCLPQTLLTVAVDLTGEEQFLETKSIQAWKSSQVVFPKKPAIFVLLA